MQYIDVCFLDTQCRYQYTRMKRSQEVSWTDEELSSLQQIVKSTFVKEINWTEVANQHYKTLLKNVSTKVMSPVSLVYINIRL